MPLYPDVPVWIRINNGNAEGDFDEERDRNYYRDHATELIRELHEIIDLEQEGIIPTDSVTTTHERYRRSHK